ncbi:unnamed protein product [Coffea canephora]|uniref:Uncharacterized protein n=1 Tax=Coffea canephora TaxID=49390 RepID=A0A068V455_COFCA|nr:unnamed protein product [Coffea canephora]
MFVNQIFNCATKFLPNSCCKSIFPWSSLNFCFPDICFPFSQEDLFTWQGPSIFKRIHQGSSKRNSSFFLIWRIF